jgi:hypothetical protein
VGGKDFADRVSGSLFSPFLLSVIFTKLVGAFLR